jgi:hypothetical protein
MTDDEIKKLSAIAEYYCQNDAEYYRDVKECFMRAWTGYLGDFL